MIMIPHKQGKEEEQTAHNVGDKNQFSVLPGLCHDIVDVVFFQVLLGLQSLGWVGHRSQNAFDRMHRWQTIENFNRPNFHASIVINML